MAEKNTQICNFYHGTDPFFVALHISPLPLGIELKLQKKCVKNFAILFSTLHFTGKKPYIYIRKYKMNLKQKKHFPLP